MNMGAGVNETFTLLMVAIPSILFAIAKLWLALLMRRGTRVHTEIGRWLVHMYGAVAAYLLLVGFAYLFNVSDLEGWTTIRFVGLRQIMRIFVFIFSAIGIFASYKVWREVENLEHMAKDIDEKRHEIRDVERDIARDLDRDAARDVTLDIQKDIYAEIKSDIVDRSSSATGGI